MFQEVFCPNCGHIHTPEMSEISLSLPPTGGDYEWLETEANATCKACSFSFELRVRVDLDTQEVDGIVYFPYPVSGEVYALVRDLSYKIDLIGFFANESEAKSRT